MSLAILNLFITLFRSRSLMHRAYFIKCKPIINTKSIQLFLYSQHSCQQITSSYHTTDHSALIYNGILFFLNNYFHLPRLREANVLVHFHSFSCVATFTSSITRGTQPPNTNILKCSRKWCRTWDIVMVLIFVSNHICVLHTRTRQQLGSHSLVLKLQKSIIRLLYIFSLHMHTDVLTCFQWL